MTEKQALAEAQRRWGKRGHVRSYAIPRRFTGATRHVGYLAGGLMFMVQGHGTNWAEAFEQVDRRLSLLAKADEEESKGVTS